MQGGGGGSEKDGERIMGNSEDAISKLGHEGEKEFEPSRERSALLSRQG